MAIEPTGKPKVILNIGNAGPSPPKSPPPEKPDLAKIPKDIVDIDLKLFPES